MQSDIYAKPCKICQHFKKMETIYGHLPHNNMSELKPCDLVHVDLIGTYIHHIIQQQPGAAIIRNNVILTCTTIINPSTGWLEIVEIQMYDIDEVMAGNDEYIDKSSSRVSQLFNNTWVYIYPRPKKS